MKYLRTLGIATLVLLGLVALAIGALYALFDGERIKTEVANAVQSKYHRTLNISGDAKLAVWPSVAITLGKTSLSEPNSTQTFIATDGARISVAVLPLLSRKIAVSAVELHGLHANIIKHKNGQFNFADLIAAQKSEDEAADEKDAKESSKSDPVQLNIASIALLGTQVNYLDETTNQRSSIRNLDIRTGAIQADSATETFSIESLAIDAALQSAQNRLNTTLTLHKVHSVAKQVSIDKLLLDIDAKAAAASVQGHLESSFAFNMAAQTIALDQLQGKLTVAHPAMPMKQLTLPLSGHLHANLQQSSADLALQTQFDASKIALKTQIEKFSPLALGFDIRIDQLNIDKYLPPKPQSTDAASESGTSTATAEVDPKIDLSALHGLNMHGNIAIGALQVSHIKLSQLTAKLQAREGKLVVSPLSTKLYQGTLNGSLSANATGNVITVTQNLSGVAIAPLLKDVANKDILDGHGNITLDISTRGATVAALKKALHGNASLQLKNGAVKGINLAKSFRDLKAKISGAQASTQQANASEKTDFSELSASFKIANGVAHNDDLSMKSPFVRLGGVGDIDIGNSQINYLAKASIVASDAGQDGKDLQELKGLTIPVRLSGPFSQLSYKIEFGSLISDAAKAKVEDVKKEVKQKLDDAVKDKLKGLFGN